MEVGMLSASYLPGRFRTFNIPSLLPIVSHSVEIGILPSYVLPISNVSF
jgi:hypothetical protein